MRTKSITIWMLLPLVAAMVSGCATSALRSDANLGTWHEPVTNSPVRMFHDGQSGELLVLYDESSSRHHEVRARAYLLYKNESRIERQIHPAFVKTDVSRHLEPVPVFPNDAAAAAAPYRLSMRSFRQTNFVSQCTPAGHLLGYTRCRSITTAWARWSVSL